MQDAEHTHEDLKMYVWFYNGKCSDVAPEACSLGDGWLIDVMVLFVLAEVMICS
jgi:hypothetical protein